MWKWQAIIKFTSSSHSRWRLLEINPSPCRCILWCRSLCVSTLVSSIYNMDIKMEMLQGRRTTWQLPPDLNFHLCNYVWPDVHAPLYLWKACVRVVIRKKDNSDEELYTKKLTWLDLPLLHLHQLPHVVWTTVWLSATKLTFFFLECCL